MIVDIDLPTRGVYQTAGCPIRLSDPPAEIIRPPLPGEHTDDVASFTSPCSSQIATTWVSCTTTNPPDEASKVTQLTGRRENSSA